MHSHHYNMPVLSTFTVTLITSHLKEIPIC